jgi:hypothetical protein
MALGGLLNELAAMKRRLREAEQERDLHKALREVERANCAEWREWTEELCTTLNSERRERLHFLRSLTTGATTSGATTTGATTTGATTAGAASSSRDRSRGPPNTAGAASSTEAPVAAPRTPF